MKIDKAKIAQPHSETYESSGFIQFFVASTLYSSYYLYVTNSTFPGFYTLDSIDQGHLALNAQAKIEKTQRF